MDKFIFIKEYGQLMIDRIFFDAGYPMLFSCKNEKNDLFICVCCQNNSMGQKWLLSLTSPSSIIDLLQNKISIRDIFLLNNKNRISINYKNEKFEIVFDNESDWKEDSIYLPKKGEYLDGDDGEFEEDIKYYEELL